MARWLMVVGALALLSLPAASVSAGGGASCPGGPYEVLSGTTVSMSKNCFRATVVHVDPGERVTFLNEDPFGHTVAGVAGTFGEPHRDVPAGKSVAFRFGEEGVYPFFCTYHPGMAGAVVVGDGIGPKGLGKAAERFASGGADVQLADRTSPAGSELSTERSSGEASSPLVPAAWAGVAAGAGFLGGFVLRRRRRR